MKKILLTLAVLGAVGTLGITAEAKGNDHIVVASAKTPQAVKQVEPVKKKPAFEDKRIVINLASRLLTLYQGDVGIRMYPIAPGAPDTPTPEGRRTVVDMEVNPEWIDPDDPKHIVPSGPDNPIGYRWIGIGGNYGIHGTNLPQAIGTYASHGCVRMNEKDVEDLFDHIVMGIPVDIIYERVVITEDANHEISYYIYPDGYNKQPLTADKVREKLKPYGVAGFVSDEELTDAILSSAGTPNPVAVVKNVWIGNNNTTIKAVQKGEHLYIPVMPLAKELGIPATWSPNWQEIRTVGGKAPGVIKAGILYIDQVDLLKVFGEKARNIEIK